MLMVTEEKLRRLLQDKFSYGIPSWAMKSLVNEIVEECKKVDNRA